MTINGETRLIAHLGYPTHSFKAPLIFNPWFCARGINAVVMPMGVYADAAATALPIIFALSNFHGSLMTMPLKILVLPLLDEVSTAVKIAGACNAVLRHADGRLIGDLFDGEGFVRGLRAKGCTLKGASAIIAGSGGVGSAIAASLAGTGVAKLALFDVEAATAKALAKRLQQHYPQIETLINTQDPAGFDIVVNATPLGMRAGDPMPFDLARLSQNSFVGEVVMTQAITPFLKAAQERGCRTQIGLDMLFEQIPAYLEFFGFGAASVDELRQTALIDN